MLITGNTTDIVIRVFLVFVCRYLIQFVNIAPDALYWD